MIKELQLANMVVNVMVFVSLPIALAIFYHHAKEEMRYPNLRRPNSFVVLILLATIKISLIVLTIISMVTLKNSGFTQKLQ